MPTDHRNVSLTGYLATFAALVVLALFSLVLSFVGLGAWAMPIALVVAGIKALLVALVFMHLVEQPSANSFVALSALALVVVFIGLVVADVDTRPSKSVSGGVGRDSRR